MLNNKIPKEDINHNRHRAYVSNKPWSCETPGHISYQLANITMKTYGDHIKCYEKDS